MKKQLTPIQNHKKNMKVLTYGLSTIAIVLVSIVIILISGGI